MTTKEIDESVKKMKAFTKEIVKDKQKCRDFLVGAGIYNPDGTLAAPYNGDDSNWAFMSGFPKK